ncbi:MAG TPA: PQQ-dependent sugar dehydrogenase [Chitinophagales bacterium]|nr:PQQ-dependent sugar dehydrogenase [Chitinophagales bacterium]
MKHLFSASLLCAMIELSAQPTIALSQYATGFSSPVDIAHCGDERLFIVEQSGYIRIIDGQGNVKPQAFLDIDSRVQSGGEEGLLGLAFHPDYKNNGWFFVYYTNTSGNLVISRFSVSATNPDSADAASETIVLTVAHPGRSNHNGGNLEFGPDGYLYIGTGDGGGGGDPDDNGQNPLSLLGKILRLDVDTLPYRIPPDNPFYGFASVRNEIWALGLRNPWRFSFDRLTGDLWTADVGQNAWEEVDFQPAASNGGENYGWRCYEGNNFYSSSGFGCNTSYTFPVHEYAHSGGRCSVTGGYVYRGCSYPVLFGHYVFCDYCTGEFWTIYNNGGSWQVTTQLNSANFRFSSFGEDMNSELYVTGLDNGVIYKITETTQATLPTIVANPGTSFCPGGIVTLSTQPGFASYDWFFNDQSSAGSGLQIMAGIPGKFTLTVTGNNGCIYTTPGTTITELATPAPVVSAAFNSFCEGDSLQLTTGNFNSYNWSDGSTGASTYAQQSGSYAVTVTDANGCTGASSPFVVTEIPNPVPVIQQSGYMCAGSSVDLSTGTFAAYAWSTGETTQQITVSQPGDYDVTVTDVNGCLGISDKFTVIDGQLPQPVITSSNGNAFCEGGNTELDAGSGYSTYSWNTGGSLQTVTVSISGGYVVTVSDVNGCMGVSDTFVVNILPLPPIPTISQPDGGHLAASESGYRYQWYLDGNLLPDDTSQTIVFQSWGEYVVEILDSNGCASASQPYTPWIDGIHDTWLTNISIQPNPFTSEIIVHYTLDVLADSKILLLDLTGKEISTLLNEKQNAGSHTVIINTEKLGLSSGIFFLEISNGIMKRAFKMEKL